MKLRKIICALAIALLICGTTVQAQDQKQAGQTADPTAPIPPLNSDLGGGYGKHPAAAARGVSTEYDPAPYDPSQVTPDQNTLAGDQLFGTGSLEHAHNVFDPAISFSELGQTYPLGTGQGNLNSVTLVGGSMSFDRTWSNFQFKTVYDGGEAFNKGEMNAHYQFHDLTVEQEIDWARWHVLLRDDFIASAGASYTGTGMGGPGLVAALSSSLGVSVNGLAQGYIPNETIQTGYSMRYMNNTLGQAEYSFNRRSAFTFSGSYGLLHFTDTGYLSSHMYTAQAGYDYLLDPANSVAVLGSYENIGFAGSSLSTSGYTAAFAYGRKITGRLAFQIGAGPQLIQSMVASGGFRLWIGAVNSALTYQRRRSSYSLTFVRGLTNGSGVFLGATGNTFTGSSHYQVTRFLTASISAGYAINNSLAPAGAAAIRFDDWFVGASLGRQIGPRAQINVNYGLQKQYSPVVCPVTNCGTTGFQQSFGMTVNWHLRPAG